MYSVTPQIYGHSGITKPLHRKGRALLGISESSLQQKDVKQPIRIFLNYDAVGHSPERDCLKVGDIVKVGVTCDLLYLFFQSNRVFEKKYFLIFLEFLNCLNVLILKINFKK